MRAPPLSCVTNAQDVDESNADKQLSHPRRTTERTNYGSESSAAGLNDYDHPNLMVRLPAHLPSSSLLKLHNLSF
jgi:hypothetical protein